MKYLKLLFVLLAVKLNAQSELKFDKRFVESEDKWVAFKPDDEGNYIYGFIFIDPQAGLTLNYEGTFTVLSTGEYVPQKMDTASVKIRLEPNNVLVAFIPDYKFQELKISAIPDWLHNYQTDLNSVERLYNWGYMYNAWGECAKALTFLEKAHANNPSYEGLAVELAFSYNCLKEYQKAEAILEKEIKEHPDNAYVNKEYIYTLTKNNKIEEAVKQFNDSVKKLKDKQHNAENCYNILQYYYIQKDKVNFNKWYLTLKKHPNENPMITKYADSMKADINQ